MNLYVDVVVASALYDVMVLPPSFSTRVSPIPCHESYMVYNTGVAYHEGSANHARWYREVELSNGCESVSRGESNVTWHVIEREKFLLDNGRMTDGKDEEHERVSPFYRSKMAVIMYVEITLCVCLKTRLVGQMI